MAHTNTRPTLAIMALTLVLMTVPRATVTAQVVPASSSQTTTQPDITVIAPKPIDGHVAKKFALGISAPVRDQVARFNDPICPITLGFPGKLGRQIMLRMLDDITAAHATIGKPGCASNLVVIATRNGDEFMRAAQRLHSPLLRAVDDGELKRLTASHEAARSWTITNLQDETGWSLEHDFPAIIVREVHDMSRLRLNTRESIMAAAVLFEWPALVGKSSTQIADYAAMRTLAKTKPVETAGVDTILALFAGAAPPKELTMADREYLRSLYDMPAYIGWRRQVDTIASDLERISKRR